MLLPALRWFVVALAVSLFGAVEGSHLMATLNDPLPAVLSALHAHADPVATHAGPPPSRRVVVVLVDGLGAEPFDARLREGVLGDPPWRARLDSGIPSRSRPVYHALLTGVPSWAAGIRSNAFTAERADSVADRVRAAGGRVAWVLEELPWFRELSGAAGDVVVEGHAPVSQEDFARAWDSGADLTVVHLLEVDDVGHLHGAASPEYEAESRRAMQAVAAFRAVAHDRPGGDGAIWFVGADHGHTPYGGHGGAERAVRTVTWVVLYDRWTAAMGDVGEAPPGATVAALAPTIARALGVDAPRESMVDGLPLFPALLGAPFKADAARVRAVEEARAATDARPLGDARSRATFLLGALAATLLAIVGLRRKRGVAEVLVLAAAVGGFLLAGPGLSMSDVRTEGGYLLRGLSALTTFAFVAWLLARRWASPMAMAVECAVFPLLALAAMRGSLGLSDATPFEWVIVPSLGLVPASVCGAIALVELGAAAWAGIRRSASPSASTTRG